MPKLTDVEYDILNALYFVEPFDKILEEVAAPANVVKDSLRLLIDQKMVVAMRWDEEKKDYVRSFIYNADDMHDYRYLATRDGLLAHNTRPADDEA